MIEQEKPLRTVEQWLLNEAEPEEHKQLLSGQPYQELILSQLGFYIISSPQQFPQTLINLSNWNVPDSEENVFS